MNKSLLTAALLGILSTAPVSSALAANADDSAAPADTEKCYGVAAKGKNDCKAPSAGHDCKGKAKKDNEDADWVYLKKGECEKVAGGEKTAS